MRCWQTSVENQTAMIGCGRPSLRTPRTRTPLAPSEHARTPPLYLHKKIARLLQHSCAGPLAAAHLPARPSLARRRCTRTHLRMLACPNPGCSTVRATIPCRASIQLVHRARGG